MIPIIFGLLLQDAEEFARGEKYLEKAGAALKGERLLGLYIGRKWIGHIRLTGQGTELRVAAELRHGKLEERIVFGRDMKLLSVESKSRQRTIAFTVKEGAWKQRVEEDGQVSESDGKVEPAFVWGARFLPLFAMPDEESVALVDVESDREPVKIVRLADKRKGLNVLQVGSGAWLYDDGGKMVEFKNGREPVTFRVIAEGDLGKDLKTELAVSPPKRAILDLFLAAQKKDEAAILAAFDIERFAQESEPNYSNLREGKKKEVQESARGFILNHVGNLELPEKDLLEDYFAETLDSREESADRATVSELDGTVWKLYKASNGRWLIYGISRRD